MYESSESVSKKRTFNRSPAFSLRPEKEDIKVVVLNSEGFEFEGKKNSDINIKCRVGDVIKVIHQNNSSECHLGIPNFEGISYISGVVGSPSAGSINFGFSDKVLIIDGKESPQLAVGINSQLAFVMLDHDVEIEVAGIDGKYINLNEVPSPSFAYSSRCWLFSPYGYAVGDVLRYRIKGSENSGGSILVCNSSATNSIPWWKINNLLPIGESWKIGLSGNIKFSHSIKSNSNVRVNSNSGSVITVNGIEQPKLLSACGDRVLAEGFSNDQKLGDAIIFQNSLSTIKIGEEISYISFLCANASYDPYEPYESVYFNFDGKQILYYSSKDRNSGDQIIVKQDGWDLQDLVHIRSSGSGYAEKFKMEEKGKFVISASEFCSSGYFINIYVGEKIAKEDPVANIDSDTYKKLAQKGMTIWAKSHSTYSDIKRHTYIEFPENIGNGSSGNSIYKDSLEHLQSVFISSKSKKGDLFLIDFRNMNKLSAVVEIENAIKYFSIQNSINIAVKYDELKSNIMNFFARMNRKFYFDLRNSFVSSYSIDQLRNGYVYLSSMDSGIDGKIKELATVGVKDICIESSSRLYSKYINDVYSFLTPELNKPLKYYCSRSKSNAEKSIFVPLSGNIGNEYYKDPIFDTYYGSAEIFSKIRDISTSGYSNIFIMPNGSWVFPNAKVGNWNSDSEIIRSMSDAISKISDDYGVSVGLSVFVKSAQENFQSLCNLCSSLGVSKVVLLDAIYLDDQELVSMVKRFSSNNIEIYFEGSPRVSFDGLLSYSYCSAKWVWSVRNRGRMPDYLKGLVEAI